MKRREFITMLGGAAVGPVTARAQPGERIRRIGLLMSYRADDPTGQDRLGAFVKTLQELGWNSLNSRLELRWFADNFERAKTYAVELVSLSPDLIVVASNPGLSALAPVAGNLPIVFIAVSDPVGGGYVASLAQPGGNITGFVNFETAMGGKWVQLLKEIAPSLSRIAVLLRSDIAANVALLRAAEASAAPLGLALSAVNAQDEVQIRQAIVTQADQPGGGLIVMPNPVSLKHRGLIIEMAERHRLPAIYPFRYFASEGGLISYGIDQADQWPGAARYVSRILRGEKTHNLPVQNPTRYETAINLKAAKTLGISVPLSLLARADEVIE